MKTTGLRQSFGRDGKRRKAAMHLIPNLFTTGNLLCGVFSMLSVFNADYMVAAVAILVAMIFDVLDGKSARLTNSKNVGGDCLTGHVVERAGAVDPEALLRPWIGIRFSFLELSARFDALLPRGAFAVGGAIAFKL